MNGIAVISGGATTILDWHIMHTVPDPASTPSVDRIGTGSFGSRIAEVTLAGGYALPFGAFVLYTDRFRFYTNTPASSAFQRKRCSRANLQFGSSSG
jgi:hypothetical protein